MVSWAQQKRQQTPQSPLLLNQVQQHHIHQLLLRMRQDQQMRQRLLLLLQLSPALLSSCSALSCPSRNMHRYGRFLVGCFACSQF
jgi:hypothetical protein